MNKYFLQLTIFCVICSGFGCSNKKLVISDIDYHIVEKTLQKNQLAIYSMKCDGVISLETTNISQTASFELKIRKPDSIMISIEGPFGIRIGVGLITRSGFIFYNSFDNKVIYGSSNAENISKILRVELEFDDLINLFSGGTFAKNDNREPDYKKIEDGNYVFIYEMNNGTKKYYINPETHNIIKLQFLDRRGKIMMEESFGDFQTVGGVLIPHEIRMTKPQERQRISMFYSNVDLNNNFAGFTFDIPESAEKVYWQ